MPERADADALADARDLLAAFLDALEPWDPAMRRAGPAPRPRAGCRRRRSRSSNQMLGEGEVSIQIDGARTRPHPGERVHGHLAGVRARRATAGSSRDWLEAGAAAARSSLESARAAAAPAPAPVAHAAKAR